MQYQQFSKEHDRRKFLKLGTCAGFGLVLVDIGFSSCSRLSKRKENNSISDKFALIAYCCLKCDECDAYIATQNDDNKLRAKVAARWKMKSEQINCDGCKSSNALFNCSAKKCARQKNVITCAHCEDFPSCDNEIWTRWPKLKKNTEDVKEELKI